jgi:hypothetical protein
MPNPPQLQEDKHGHDHHGTDRAATLFVYGTLAALIGWIVLFLFLIPLPDRW